MDILRPDSSDCNVPQKQCSACKDWFPATLDYFHASEHGKYGLYSQCKKCKNKKGTEYHQRPEIKERDREHIQAYQEAYRQRPEAQKRADEYQKAYRQVPENREYKRAYLQEYRTRPEAQERHREWLREYRTNPEVRARMNEQERARYKSSPKMREQVRNRVNNRAALRKSAPGSHTLTQLKEQFGRQKHKCYYCQQKVTWGKHHVDHVIPLSRGGSNDISNLVITCASCNLRKNDRLPHEWHKGGRLL